MKYVFKNQSLVLFHFILLGTLTLTSCAPGSSSGTDSGADEDSGSPTAYSFYAKPNNLSAVWANDGGDKVTRQGTPASQNTGSVLNSVWTGSKIKLFAAKNEVVSFNLVLEAAQRAASTVSIVFDKMNGPRGSSIGSAAVTGDGVFNYTQRDIELFYVRYLKIRGLSRLGYEQYDERHIPKRLRRSFTGEGNGTGTWNDRPDHDKDYPDIAVPFESVRTFSIAQGQNQSVWTDIYVPKDVPTGTYQGAVTVTENANTSYIVPVELSVRNFTLPDVPASKSMLYLGYSDVAKRYVGEEFPNGANATKVNTIRDRHFQMAHRHKISLIDSNEGTSQGVNKPVQEWMARLDGSLFTAGRGYRGPGTGVGNGIYSVGTYGSWNWQGDGHAGMNTNANAWSNWFAQNSPGTEYFLYLIDESSNYGQIQTWAQQLRNSGSAMKSMATLSLPSAQNNTPALQVVTSTMDVGDTGTWNNALATLRSDPTKRFYMYNGKRPASGSFMTDDDGIALREMPWGQYKKGVDRWFYWESTYYKDYQGGRGHLDVFNQAQTFGGNSTFNNILGQTAGNYGNGDGVLFYPGTDTVFPSSSYGLSGPIASLRLKHWRRGIQDVDYIALANAKDPARTQAIVNSMARKVLWENGVADPNDPTWVRCDIGWPTDADSWESARLQLANIIDGGTGSK